MNPIKEGFVVEAEEEGLLLDRNNWWTPNGRKPETGYVHSFTSLMILLHEWNKWQVKPGWLYPAKWSDRDGTVIIGPRIKFE